MYMKNPGRLNIKMLLVIILESEIIKDIYYLLYVYIYFNGYFHNQKKTYSYFVF